jgi:hypothetical protein
MLKTILKSDVLKDNICEYKLKFLKTTIISCLKACKTDNILKVRLNSAFIANIYNYLFIKKLNTDKLAF